SRRAWRGPDGDHVGRSRRQGPDGAEGQLRSEGHGADERRQARRCLRRRGRYGHSNQLRQRLPGAEDCLRSHGSAFGSRGSERQRQMSSAKAMYAGVSGMSAESDTLSIVGDNISNANTVGFKKSRAMFENILGGAVGSAETGGGVKLGKSQQLFAQGALVN